MAAFLNCIIFWVLYYFELQVEEDKQIQGILYVSLSKMWQCDVIRTLWKISEIEYKSGIYWWRSQHHTADSLADCKLIFRKLEMKIDGILAVFIEQGIRLFEE